MATIVYYVDWAAGSNGNDGSSPAQAWAELSYALTTGITAHNFDNDICEIRIRGNAAPAVTTAPAADVGITLALSNSTGTPDAQNFLRIIADPAGWSPDVSATIPGPILRLASTAPSTPIWSMSAWCEIDGFDLVNNGSATNTQILWNGNSATGSKVRNCLLRNTPRSFGAGSWLANYWQQQVFENVGFISGARGLDVFGGSSQPPIVRNCVFAELSQPAFGTATAAQTPDCSNSAFFNVSSIGNAANGGSGNAREAATSDPGGMTFTVTNLVAGDFVAGNTTAWDYRAAEGGNLENAGVFAQAADPDMFGTARNDPPEIGYFEVAVAAPSIGTVDHDAGGGPTDTTLSAGATAQVNDADGGTYWAGIWEQASRPTTHAQIVAGTGAVGAVQTGTVPGGGLVTLGEYTGLTELTPYALYVTAEDDQATPVPDGQAGFDDFTTLEQALVVVIPLVDVETGAPWPDGRTIFYDLWNAADWHNTGTPQPAAEVGSGVTADGGILTISTFALNPGDPTFTVMYEEEGTTPGFSPDDFFGVSRQNSVELGLIDTQGAAQYIESPQGSVNWVEITEFLNSKQVMSRTQVAMQTGSTFRLVFDFDVVPEMLALNLWRALGAGPPDNAAQTVVQVDARTLDVTFAKVYDPGRNAVLQFIGVKYGEGSSIPRSTWPRQSP